MAIFFLFNKIRMNGPACEILILITKASSKYSSDELAHVDSLERTFAAPVYRVNLKVIITTVSYANQKVFSVIQGSGELNMLKSS